MDVNFKYFSTSSSPIAVCISKNLIPYCGFKRFIDLVLKPALPAGLDIVFIPLCTFPGFNALW